MNAAQIAKQAMEEKLSAIAGRAVELTIRGDRSFTFYFDGVCEEAAQRLAASVVGENVQIDADAELGTCVYVN